MGDDSKQSKTESVFFNSEKTDHTVEHLYGQPPSLYTPTDYLSCRDTTDY